MPGYVFWRFEGIVFKLVAVSKGEIVHFSSLANMTYDAIESILLQCVRVVGHHRWHATLCAISVNVLVLVVDALVLGDAVISPSLREIFVLMASYPPPLLFDSVFELS